jgi:hypothetical protein
MLVEFQELIFVPFMTKFPYATIEKGWGAVEFILNHRVSVEFIKRVALFAIEIFALRIQFLSEVLFRASELLIIRFIVLRLVLPPHK